MQETTILYTTIMSSLILEDCHQGINGWNIHCSLYQQDPFQAKTPNHSSYLIYTTDQC